MLRSISPAPGIALSASAKKHAKNYVSQNKETRGFLGIGAEPNQHQCNGNKERGLDFIRKQPG